MTHISAVPRRRWYVVLVPIVVVAVWFGYTATRTPTYVATSTVSVDFNADPWSDPAAIVPGSLFAQQRLATYAQLATQDSTLGQVRQTLNLPISNTELATHVAVASVVDTNLLNITVTDTDPQRAAAIANTVSTVLRIAVPRMETTVEGQATVSLTPVTVATAPDHPV